jgi:hypothetical protein
VKRVALLISVIGLTSLMWAFWPRDAYSHNPITTTVLFNREIVRIFENKCLVCHTEQGMAIPLTTYEQARPWAEAIKEEILQRTMPPWAAVAGYGQFANDLGLTTREREFLISWIDGGAPKGEALVSGVQGPSPVSNHDHADGDLGQPDMVRPLPDAFTVQPGRSNDIQRSVVELGLTSDRWVRAIGFKPGDRRVVRAAFFSVAETGQWLGGWTPWHEATSLPSGVAFRLPAGSRIATEIHYRGAAEPVEDRSSLALYFAAKPTEKQPSDLVIQSGPGAVPPKATGLRVYGELVVPEDSYAFALRPEMHAGGRSLEVKAIKPDGSIQILVWVRNYRQDWQTPYIFKEPVFLPNGTKLAVTAYYDNPSEQAQTGSFRVTLTCYRG